MTNAEAAEFSKLADTTYRDVNIALATEFAHYAERVGVDITEVIAAANSQPYSHIHQPGIGVGGHCIPVYPHFLLSRAPELSLVAASRRVNDGQVERAVRAVASELGAARRRAGPGARAHLPGRRQGAGVQPRGAADRGAGGGRRACPRLRSAARRTRRRALGAEPWTWGAPAQVRAIVTQTGDPRWRRLDWAWFPELAIVYDGRNSLRDLALPATVTYRGIGLPPRPRSVPA